MSRLALTLLCLHHALPHVQASFSTSVIYQGTSADTRQKLSYDGTGCRSELVQGALWGTAGTWVATFLHELA